VTVSLLKSTVGKRQVDTARQMRVLCSIILPNTMRVPVTIVSVFKEATVVLASELPPMPFREGAQAPQRVQVCTHLFFMTSVFYAILAPLLLI
jgi:hypothetical protein